MNHGQFFYDEQFDPMKKQSFYKYVYTIIIKNWTN